MAANNADRVGEVLRRYVTDEAEMAAVLKGEPFQTALSIDSLTMVHVVTELEKEFGVRFDPETIDKVFETINSLLAFLGEAPETNPG